MIEFILLNKYNLILFYSDIAAGIYDLILKTKSIQYKE